MSEHGFHVHGPHDHAVEHAAQGGDSFSSNIAVMTAIPRLRKFFHRIADISAKIRFLFSSVP